MPTLKTEHLITIIAILGVVILSLLGSMIWMVNRAPAETADTAPQTTPEVWPTVRPTVTPTATPTAQPTVTPQPTATPIVVKWKELGYLTSVEYTLQTTVALERSLENETLLDAVVGVLGGGSDRIFLSAIGNVQAGIDMGAIEDDDVVIEGSTVKLRLQPAIITSVELLPEETQIFDSNQRWFLSDYQGLEVDALGVARSQLEDWATNRIDITGRAETLAISQLQNFLRQLGFQTIEITIEESPNVE